LNYLCNDNVASVVTNTGKGFFWYKSSLLRITKYDNPIDYLPRDFIEGRDIFVEDVKAGKVYELFKDYDKIECHHGLSSTKIIIIMDGLEFKYEIFVPKDDSCECWILDYKNTRKDSAHLKIRVGQTWAVARFGIHTAEEGIPYLSTPGKEQFVSRGKLHIELHTENPELPVPVHAYFVSPEANQCEFKNIKLKHSDGREFVFVKAEITSGSELKSGEKGIIRVASGVEESIEAMELCIGKYSSAEVYESGLLEITRYKDEIFERNRCDLPDKNMQKFMNIWLKHQLFLTYRFVRSGYIGYRDSLQDSWGYQLVEPHMVKNRILQILSHMNKDGSCPRNFSPFGINDNHDHRNFMDSATWIGMGLTGYIKETGDSDILKEKIRYLDCNDEDSVDEHVWKALNLLYEKRGLHGLCLIGEGDWNDGIEGISKKGPAVSVWLTIAAYYFQKLMSELYEFLGETEKVRILRDRSAVLKDAVNEKAWDGEWYIYAFSGTGKPIGSHLNNEGKIHLNSNTWAVFTGIADSARSNTVMKSIEKYLGTYIGPALLAPPYINDGDEVGRIARLEPGTFENGSVYKHAVAFKVFADIENNEYEKAYETFIKVLPTNPENPDSRRTSEPYCLGNYYCGPSHERFGQNFFSWFTGSPAWLLRAGYDKILGVEPDYEGLIINPRVPETWNDFNVRRTFRDTVYEISF
ncbi:MAG: hypothetical protein JXN62_01970, partial [Bacteroidales bacterium]|nr:hypothetical protein [Bacteroidales bacterium]